MADALLNSDTPLAENVPCLRCGYNLRTKRASEVCPECEAGVGPSIQYHAEGANVVPQPKLAALGFTLLAVSFALGAGEIFAIYLMLYGHIPPVLISWPITVLAFVQMLCLCAGIVIVLHAQHRSRPSTPIRRILLLAATVGCGSPAILLDGSDLIRNMAGFRRGEAPFPLSILDHLGGALYTINRVMFIPFIFLFMLYLLPMGKRLGTPILRWTTCALLIALALVNVFDLSELTLIKLIKNIVGKGPLPEWFETLNQVPYIANVVLYAAVTALMLLHGRSVLAFGRKNRSPARLSNDFPPRMRIRDGGRKGAKHRSSLCVLCVSAPLWPKFFPVPSPIVSGSRPRRVIRHSSFPTSSLQYLEHQGTIP